MQSIEEIFAFNGTGLDTVAVVLCLVFGVGIAVIISFFLSYFSGKIVRKYAEFGIYGKEDAMSLTETGLGNKAIYTVLLRNRGALRRYIKVANEEEANAGGRFRLSRAKLYLDKEKEQKAFAIYGEKETTLWQFILILVILIIAGIAAVILIPLIKELIAKMFTA